MNFPLEQGVLNSYASVSTAHRPCFPGLIAIWQLEPCKLLQEFSDAAALPFPEKTPESIPRPVFWTPLTVSTFFCSLRWVTIVS